MLTWRHTLGAPSHPSDPPGHTCTCFHSHVSALVCIWYKKVVSAWRCVCMVFLHERGYVSTSSSGETIASPFHIMAYSEGQLPGRMCTHFHKHHAHSSCQRLTTACVCFFECVLCVCEGVCVRHFHVATPVTLCRWTNKKRLKQQMENDSIFPRSLWTNESAAKRLNLDSIHVLD